MYRYVISVDLLSLRVRSALLTGEEDQVHITISENDFDSVFVVMPGLSNVFEQQIWSS